MVLEIVIILLGGFLKILLIFCKVFLVFFVILFRFDKLEIIFLIDLGVVVVDGFFVVVVEAIVGLLKKLFLIY